MSSSFHFYILLVALGAALGPAMLSSQCPAVAQSAAQPAYAGVFEGSGVRLELKAAPGGGLVGTVTLEKSTFPVKARVEGKQLLGSFAVKGQDIPFKGSLQGEELTVSSDFDTHVLQRVAAKPTTASGAASKPGGAIGSGWKLLQHPSGLQAQYPPEWKLQEAEGTYRLDTGDAEEVVLIGAFPAGGIQDPKDPRVAQAADQLIAAQFGGALQRLGGVTAAKDGAGRGIALLYGGEIQGKKVQARLWITVLKDAILGVTAIMPEAKLGKRQATLEKVFASLKEFKVELDRKLVGSWRRFSETILDAKSSGGRKPGDASAVSNRNITATLAEDGKLLYRVTGKGIASGAGQFVEYDLNETHKGTWSATGGKLLLIWEDGSTDEYDYSLAGGRLVLRGGGREYVYQR